MIYHRRKTTVQHDCMKQKEIETRINNDKQNST